MTKGMWPLIQKRAAASPESLMLVDEDDQRLSFLQFQVRLERVAAALRSRGVGAGMFFVHTLLSEGREMLPSTDSQDDAQADLENMMRWLPRANAAGVKILCGDDYGIVLLPHGRYAEELTFYTKHVGIPPADVLRWATVNGSDLLGREGSRGHIEIGSRADLLVVDGDPSSDLSVLEDGNNLRAIMLAGRFVKNDLAGSS